MTRGANLFLLMVGDDGALLVPGAAGLASVFAAGPEEACCAPILAALAQQPAWEVLILADTLAQEFRREDLPRLGFSDRRKLLARRLAQAFPTAPLAAAVPLKRGTALLAALPEGGPIAAWLERLKKVPNPSGRVALLPLESAAMLPRLLPEAKKGWAMLLSWQRTGGFRQIVTHDGDLIFTRLTPPLPFATSAHYAAATIALDLQATLGYLARLGLTESSALNLVALAPERLHPALNDLSFPLRQVLALTPHQAALRLALPFAPAPDDPAGDLLHAAWLLRRSRPRLALMPREARQAAQYAALARGVNRAAAMTWLAALLWLGWQGIGVLHLLQAAREQAGELQNLRTQIAETRAHAAPLTAPLGRLQQAVARQRAFSRPAPAPWRLLDALESGLGASLKVSRFVWTSGEDDKVATLRFALRVRGADNFAAETLDLNRLAQKLPRRDISMEPQAATPAPTALSNDGVTSDVARPEPAEYVLREMSP